MPDGVGQMSGRCVLSNLQLQLQLLEQTRLRIDDACHSENPVKNKVQKQIKTLLAAVVRRSFRKRVLNESGCLHYLLASPRTDASYKLRRRPKFAPLITKTTRFGNSSITYGLRNYQSVGPSCFNALIDMFCVVCFLFFFR